jgi:hypothetical protein
MRLFYYNPRAHSGQNQTFGYYMSNKTHYNEKVKGRLEERYSICSSKENSFEHFIMKGKVLEQYEYYAE